MWPVCNMDSRHGTSADGPAFPWSSWHLSPDQWCSCYVTDRCRNWYRHRQPPSGKYFFLSLCNDCRHGRCFFRTDLDGSFSTASHSFIEMGSGDPLGAFIAAFVAIELARLMTGRFNMDIILAPLAGILGGCLCGFWIGIPVHSLMEQLSRLISWGMQQHPLVMGITVAVFMGMVCAMPLSAPALAMILQLNGTAAGAATIGCCCSMIGLALAGYRDNGIAGFLAVGLGTSKLQFPKIIQRPVIWLPSILSSAILGPIGVLFAKMTNSTAGAGLGTTIFMGPVMSWQTMAPGGDFAVILVKILVMYFILPGVLTLSIANAMRKLNIMKPGDMSLNL